MPNWCQNELNVSGKPKDLDAFAARVELTEDGAFKSLKDTFLPTPRELEFCTGAHTIDGHRVDAWYEHKHTKDGTTIYTPVTDAQKSRFLKKYGASDWYSWNVKFWGAKWGDCEGHAERLPRRIHFAFDTPWGPPEAGIAIISGIFPALTFSLYYWEGGMGFRGKTVFKNGAVTKRTEGKYSGPRGG